MPKGRDSKNDPRRRPKIIDLDHFRQTKEIKDVAEVNEMRKKENLDRKNAAELHTSDTSRPVYDHVEEEKKAAELESKVSEDTDPTPYQGIPRPKEAEEYPEEADFIDRNPANKTMIEKIYEKFEKSYDDWKNEKKKEDE
jgi:hypothetical protein